MASIKIDNILKNSLNKPTLTKFLTIAEQNELINRGGDFKIIFSNTYPNEERKRAFVSMIDTEITPDFQISVLQIQSSQVLKHSDILGAILNLGIDREVIGDIIVDEQVVFCIKEMENYLASNLKKIRNLNVQLEKIVNFYYSGNTNYIEKQIILNSLRLDGIIAKSFNLSRSNAQELVNQRMVSINGNIEQRCDYNCIESDIVSVRRLGRIKILDVTRKTKKDKLVLNILLYKV